MAEGYSAFNTLIEKLAIFYNNSFQSYFKNYEFEKKGRIYQGEMLISAKQNHSLPLSLKDTNKA